MTLTFSEKPTDEEVAIVKKVIESLWDRLRNMSALEFLTALDTFMESGDIEQLWRK